MLDLPERAGNLDLGELPSRWRKLDYFTTFVRNEVAQRKPQSIDPRAVDEALQGGHRLYPQVELHLSAAWDCHVALPKLLEAHGATNTATWSLMRTQFEASFRALWLLAPSQSRDRVLRAIRIAWVDDKAARTYTQEILNDPLLDMPMTEVAAEQAKSAQMTKEHEKTFNDEVEHLTGHRWKRAPQDINMIDELTKLDERLGGGRYRILFRHTWRTLAGLQHADTSALLRASDTAHAERMGKTTRMLITPSDQHFQTLGLSTSLLTQQALARYLQCHQPTHDPNRLNLAALSDARRLWDVL